MVRNTAGNRRSRLGSIAACLALAASVACCNQQTPPPEGDQTTYTFPGPEQSLTYTLPPASVIYTEDPSYQRDLLEQSSIFIQHQPIPEASLRILRRLPDEWLWVDKHSLPARTYRPEAIADAVLFLHKRTTKEGRERLVMVGIHINDRDGRARESQEPLTRLTIVAKIMSIPTTTKKSQVESVYEFGQGAGHIIEDSTLDTAFQPGPLTFFAGQGSATESSRFVIPWKFNGKAYEMTGILEDSTDADAVNSPVKLSLKGLP